MWSSDRAGTICWSEKIKKKKGAMHCEQQHFYENFFIFSKFTIFKKSQMNALFFCLMFHMFGCSLCPLLVFNSNERCVSLSWAILWHSTGDIFPWLRENFSWLLPHFYYKIINCKNPICWNCEEHDNLNIQYFQMPWNSSKGWVFSARKHNP